MDHAAGVGVRHRLANRLEDRQEPRQVRLGPAVAARSAASVWPLTSFMAKKGRWSASVPRSYTGTTPGCWSWPQIWASSTKRSTRSEPVAMLIEQDLQGQVAAQVRVAAPEHQPHPAAGDLAQELIATGRRVGARRGLVASCLGSVVVQDDTRDDRPHPGADARQDDAAVFGGRDIEVEGPIAA